MKYKLKTEPVEALQYPGYFSPEVEAFAGKYIHETEPREGIGVIGRILHTPNGDKWIHNRDWIIRAINGDFFLMDDYEFRKKYEKVEE